MRTAPTNSDDTIDSRDVIERIAELEIEREALHDDVTETETAMSALPEDERDTVSDTAQAALDALDGWDTDNAAELAALKALQDQAEGYSDWSHGAQLIRDSYFPAAMDEMLADCGDWPKDLPSYLTVTVDYDALQSDYTSVEFDGVTYWVR